MLHNQTFPAECQHALNELRIGIVGDGLAVDASIANLAGLGIQTIYCLDKKSEKRTFREEFLEIRYPELVYVETQEDQAKFKENNDLDHIITINSQTEPLAESINAILEIDEIRKEIYQFLPEEKRKEVPVRIKDYPGNNNKKLDVLVIGAGGIGNYFALAAKERDYTVTFVDNDVFEKSNLNRQIFAEIGKNKAEVLAQYNPKWRGINAKFDSEFRNSYVKEESSPDIVVGCVDNTYARNEIRVFAKELGIPYFDGGVSESSGQILLNPSEFSETNQEKIERKTASCRFVSNPSVVIPNAIIGIQLARVLGNYNSYKFNYNTLHPDRIGEEINGEWT